MEIGYLSEAWSARKNLGSIRHPVKILGYGCENCGYVEFYLETKETKEKKE